MNEWKDIPGFEGYFQASTSGEIKSLERKILLSNGTTRIQHERILKQQLDKNGYLTVELNKNGKRKFCRVNRLIALTFIPNDDPVHKTQVNHIKEFEKQNNNVYNLEWCTPKENSNYGTRTSRIAKSQSIPVYQYSKEYKFIKRWSSFSQVENELGIHHSNIVACCTGRRKSTGGYIWSYTKLD